MNIVKTINQYNEEFVYFLEPIRNNIINNGSFIKIIYSTPFITFNGIYVNINLTYIGIEKYFNKFKCVFDINYHKDIVERIKYIESSILNKYISNKEPQYKIYDQLKNGNIKIVTSSERISNSFLLKIAGIWENESEYGLTYKFINL
jgi:hypothetical protein